MCGGHYNIKTRMQNQKLTNQTWHTCFNQQTLIPKYRKYKINQLKSPEALK